MARSAPSLLINIRDSAGFGCVRRIFGPSLLPTILFLLASVDLAMAQSKVALLGIRGPVGPATEAYMTRALADVRVQDVDLVILEIDTPGGLGEPMQAIIREILASPVPVVGFVGPRGAVASGAGVYILYATHFAAMAPGTQIGPATAAGLEGESAADIVASIRGLAELRHRDPALAERMVREDFSIDAGDALRLEMVDVLASDPTQLLAKLEGRTIETAVGRVTLSLQGRSLINMEPGWRHELLGTITNPTFAYLLLLIGIFGLVIELMSPGLILPGVIGAGAMMTALYAFQVLPVNYAGLGMIALGVVLMGIELTLPSFGVIGMGGIVAFVFGSVLLIDTDAPGFGVSTPLVGGLAIGASAMIMSLMVVLNRSRSMPRLGGPEELIGTIATVLEWQGERGRVQARGTNWAARSDMAFKPGQRVRIVDIEGLTVDVAADAEPEGA